MWDVFRQEVLRLNTLSEFEVLQISASIYSIYDDKWNCFKCMSHENHEKFKIVKGCISTPKTNYRVEGFVLNKCLGNFASKEIYHYFELSRFYNQGIMPDGKSLNSQQAKLIDLFDTINQLSNEKKEEIRKREEAKQARLNKMKKSK